MKANMREAPKATPLGYFLNTLVNGNVFDIAAWMIETKGNTTSWRVYSSRLLSAGQLK